MFQTIENDRLVIFFLSGSTSMKVPHFEKLACSIWFVKPSCECSVSLKY